LVDSDQLYNFDHHFFGYSVEAVCTVENVAELNSPTKKKQHSKKKSKKSISKSPETDDFVESKTYKKFEKQIEMVDYLKQI
jgi:hypothetical protein